MAHPSRIHQQVVKIDGVETILLVDEEGKHIVGAGGDGSGATPEQALLIEQTKDAVLNLSSWTQTEIAKLKAGDWMYVGTGGVNFYGSWHSVAGAGKEARYRFEPPGTIRLAGEVVGGDVDDTIFALDDQHRPTVAIDFGFFSNGAPGRLRIATNGAITPLSIEFGKSVILNGLTFPLFAES